jgi:DNA polymerase-1
MGVGNPRIELAVRNADCTACKLHVQADGDDRCVTARGSHASDVLILTKHPLGPRALKELKTYLERAGFDPEQLLYTGASKCLTWDLEPTKTTMKACKPYLEAEVETSKVKWILAIGNEALYSAAGKSGIMKHRGITYDGVGGSRVVATISPAMVYRNPGQKSGFEADLRYFYNLVTKNPTIAAAEPDEIHTVDTKEKLHAFLETLANGEAAAYDLETTGFEEYVSDAAIVSMAVTVRTRDAKTSATTTECFAVPLWHPDSPWRTAWRRIMELIGKYLARVPKRIAHNGKFDNRWCRQFNARVKLTFDTMLAAHLLDENRPKGLKPLARTLLGAPPWDIQIHNVKGKPWWEVHGLDNILKYNGLDTWHTLRLYDLFVEELKKNPRLAKIMQYLMMPANEVFTDAEMHGVWVDLKRLTANYQIVLERLADVEQRLSKWIPEDHGFGEVNFNPSNFARWWLFTHLKLPVLARGKQKEDGSPGAPSMSEAVMLELQEIHEVPRMLLERAGYEKNRQFFAAYSNLVDSRGRIHTSFKLTGTVTGRLSSGKEEADKVSGRVPQRGVNLQQVPRDSFVRGVFGAAPGNYFVECDYSQVELRVAAFLAQERTMLHLYATGQDIHMAMAMRMTGKAAKDVTKEERKKAKAVNFGFLYGMGWNKFISTAWLNYGVRVTEEEAQAFRRAFFDQFPMLLKWHASCKAFARKHGYVISPLGRKRNLPDIYSQVQSVANEAGRQAINSPVQSFASDMALWSMVLVNQQFKKRGMKATPIGTVHDAVNYEVPADEVHIAVPIIKHTMENLPLQKYFGIDLNVPIIGDVKLGTHWGDSLEMDNEVSVNGERILEWMNEKGFVTNAS